MEPSKNYTTKLKLCYLKQLKDIILNYIGSVRLQQFNYNVGTGGAQSSPLMVFITITPNSNNNSNIRPDFSSFGRAFDCSSKPLFVV